MVAHGLRSGALAARETRGLYGGAIACDVPKTFDDVSNLRPVPDHQEVFVERDGVNSVIVELLDDTHLDKGLEEAARFYFADLATANEAAGSEVLQFKTLGVEGGSGGDHGSERCFLIGAQNTINKSAASRAGSDEKQTVVMVVGLLRYAQFKTDILLTLNVPPPEKKSKSNGDGQQVQAQPDQPTPETLAG